MFLYLIDYSLQFKRLNQMRSKNQQGNNNKNQQNNKCKNIDDGLLPYHYQTLQENSRQLRDEEVQERNAEKYKPQRIDVYQKGQITEFLNQTSFTVQKPVQTPMQSPKPAYKIIMPFEHPQHPHNNNFKLNFNNSQANIAYKNNNGRRAFVKNGEIAKGALSSFKIRQAKTEDRCIFIGIATNAIFSDPKAIKSKFTVTYYSRDGKLCINGAQKQGGKSVKDGEIVTLQVNTKLWQLKWIVGNEQQVSVPFPQQLKNKSLYLMIVMGHKNDTMQIMYN